MRKVLLVWELGGYLGHLARLVPIALRLREEGVAVTFSAAQASRASQFLQPWGLECTPLPLGEPACQTAPRITNHAEMLLRAGFDDVHAARVRMDALMALYGRSAADALVVDFSPLALYAARAAGIPALNVGHGYETPPVHDALPDFLASAGAGRPTLPDGQARLAHSLQALGRMAPAAPESIAQLYAPQGCALLAFRETDHFDREPESAQYAGPIWWEVSDRRVDWRPRSGSRVVCYLHQLDDACVAVARAVARHAGEVMLICPGRVSADPGVGLPANVRLVRRPVQLNPLLDEADAVLCEGGMGLVSMALHRGRPLMLVPQVLEQLILARRLVGRGLAHATVEMTDADNLSGRMGHWLADTAHGIRVAAFARKYVGFNPARAVTQVVSMLRGQEAAASSPFAMEESPGLAHLNGDASGVPRSLA